MSFDWDAIEKELDEAAKKTDGRFEKQISSLTRMRENEINELFPERSDKESLAKLVRIVNQATNENSRKKQLVENIEELSTTVIKLVKLVV